MYPNLAPVSRTNLKPLSPSLMASLFPFWFLFLLLLFFFFPTLTSSTNPCNPQTTHFTCPPFSTPPTFPFAPATQHCGHPSFQINCSSTPHSHLTINHTPFYLLHPPNRNQLTLFPFDPTTHQDHCSSLPSTPIDLSNSSFHFSPSTCSRLSLLTPCSNTSESFTQTFSNCTLNRRQRGFLSQPLRMLQGCSSSAPSCKDHHVSVRDLVGFLRSGIEVEWEEGDDYFMDCRVCQWKNLGVCGYNDSDSRKPFLCFQLQSPSSVLTDKNTNRKLVLLIEISCTIITLICLLLLVAMILRYKRRVATSSEDPNILVQKDALLLHRLQNDVHLAKLPPIFTYEELESSTNCFDQRRKLGDGGFGSVYLGQLRDGQIVAVKRLYMHHSGKTRSFCNEILILSNIDHPNLVNLHGYCCDPRGLLLVYEYISNGTLADHLHGQRRRCSSKKNLLSWEVRISMALQTAMAIEYLHFSLKPPVVHRDITTSNIFVERDWKIKVGDFGLSRLLHSPVLTGPQGTPGYLDPDYHSSFRLTEKSDVYSFGVVLFELISGMKAVDLKGREKGEVNLAEMVVGKIQAGALREVIDPSLEGEGSEVMLMVRSVAELGFRCVAVHKDDRPDMKEVVSELKRIWSELPSV